MLKEAKILLIGFISIFFLLAACEQKTTPIPSPSIPTTELFTVSPSPTEKIEISLSPTNTVTISPSQTATLLPNLEKMLKTCAIPQGFAYQVSPDEKWIAATCELGENSHLRIANLDGGFVWEPTFKTISGITPCLEFVDRFGEKNCFDGILVLDHWSKDSQSIFVNVNFVLDRAYDYSFGIYKLDIATKIIIPLLKTHNSTFTFAFSPDEENIAYIPTSGSNYLHIKSVNSGKDQSYKIPEQSSDAAFLVWSPDNQKVAFSILNDGWFDQTGGFSLAVFDTNTGKITIHLENDKRLFYPTSWISENTILLANRTDLHDYTFNISTGELTQNP